MENLLIYFLKANGLIILFYLMYVLFLRKETFFTSNRWYLISGLVLSLLLPLVTFTKIIWVEPTPIPVIYEEVIPIANNAIEVPIQENPLDWTLIFTTAYIVISMLIVMKITFELISFFNKIRKHQKQNESNFTLIHSDTTENPFSFFHYIVINPNRFSKEEFQHILTHESIHVKQKHSLDVLLGKLFCAFFWANPIIWLYRKAMLQNLEFIADSETFKQIENKYEYQKTLLKVVTHQHDLSITNQFYQSLIKKRIVMLHTNQSNKKNVWKYATILPLLVGFMLLFQIETVAQVKEVTWTSINSNNSLERIEFIITKNTTDAEIKKETELLKKEYNIELKISKIKRNKENEIIALDAKFEDNDKTSGKISIKGDKPIEPIRFFKELNENGKGNIGFDRNNISTVFAKMDTDKIEWNEAKTIEIKKSDEDEVIYIINGKEFSKDEMKDKIVELDGAIEMKENDKTGKKIMIFRGNSTVSDEPNTLIYLDDNIISEEEMKKIDAKIIKSVDVNKNNIKKEIKIVTKNSNGISEDTEIYINGKKATKEELDKIEREDIESVKVNNNNDKKTIEIQKRNVKTIQGGSWKEVEKEMEMSKAEMEKAKENIEKFKPKSIELKSGDVVIILDGDKIKFPGYPTHYLNQLKLEFQGKILEDNIDFFKNYELEKIKDLKIVDDEMSPKEKKRIKKIIIETK